MIKKYILICLALLAITANSALAELFGQTQLQLRTATAEHVLHVQVASSPQARSQGLMHRKQLAPYHGMLFDFHHTQPISMWMKNTPLKLEMLFIDKDGIIVHIAPQTTPYSTAPISSAVPVRYVLELPEGSLSRYQIALGDQIKRP